MNIRRMALFVVLLVTIVLLPGSTEIHCGGVAATARKSLSVSKQQQQQQAPIKTIQTTSGDIIDCVDINKQPAFDNPLLKNHKIEMNPGFIRKEKASVNSENMPFKDVKFDNLQACPKGTVPILRMLRRKQYTKPNAIEIPPLVPLVRHYEVVETDDGNVHYGVKGYINVNNPLVESDQLSSAQIWVQSGPLQDFNLIEAGWFVYPPFYGDNKTRLYTSWKGIQGDHKDCINYLCTGALTGFVQIDPEIYLGAVLDHSSVYGGELMYLMNTEIIRHNLSGNWWLIIHDIKVGYWPNELFSYLAKNAEKVGYGAVTGAPPNRPSPQMGNGHFPDDVDLKWCGFIARMKVFDIQGNENDIDVEHVRIAGEKSPCYKQNFRGAIDINYQTTTTFGGPGGNCG